MSLLSTRGRYAVRMMVYMATRKEGETIRKADISASEGISEDYVEQILLRLKQHGMVKSIRGAKGGFVLSLSPYDLNVAEVAEAVEGSLSVADCKGDLCERGADCVTRPIWREASKAVYDVLKAYKIRDLAREARNKKSENMLNYQI